MAASAIPYSRTPPAWLKTTTEQVTDQICKLAKKGYVPMPLVATERNARSNMYFFQSATPSQIGVVLRDSHGIAQVKNVTGKDSFIRSAEDVYTLFRLAAQKTNDVAFPTGNKILRILKSNGTKPCIYLLPTS